MKKRLVGFGVFVVGILAYLGLGGAPVWADAQSGPKTAFSILDGILDYPGLNLDLDLAAEGLKYGYIGKGGSTVFLRTGKLVDWSLGFLEDTGKQYPKVYTFSPSIELSQLRAAGVDLKLPIPDSFRLAVWIGLDSSKPFGEAIKWENLLGGFKITMIGVKI